MGEASIELRLMGKASIEKPYRLMDLVQEDLHLLRGLEQNNLAYMMNKPDRTVISAALNLLYSCQITSLKRGSLPMRRRPWGKEATSSWRSQVVQFKPLNDKYDVFILELGLQDPYTDVVGRVADKLHVSPGRISLARHCCTFDRPVEEDIVSQFNCLLDMLLTLDKVCDVLYYDVLDGPLPRKLTSVEIASGHPYAKQSCIAVQPEHISVEDLLNDQEVAGDVMLSCQIFLHQSAQHQIPLSPASLTLPPKVKLTNSNAKLRLVGVCEDTIRKVFSLEEKIENIPEYLTLRVEEIPKKKGSGHHVIHVCNNTKTDGVLKFDEEEPVKSFGFSIGHDEPFGEVKVRLRQKLFENEENIPVQNWHFLGNSVS